MLYKRMNLFLLLLLPLVSCDIIVETNTGSVRGKTLTDKKVEAFLGIPYAEPPVGPLRFKKTVPKTPWKEIYDAKELPPACIQGQMEEHDIFTVTNGTNSTMNEDCLHLNLWVPQGGSDSKTIMVFIHGGGFMMGSSSMHYYDGGALSEHGDVIVASINYRVGTLGFFSAFTHDAPGSMGMYDQVMALRWIKDNAKKFGGDPDNIVLFGESAGGFSVSMHMISPLSKNLFKRAILQSGSAFNPMYSENNTLLSTGSARIANLLGCADDDEAFKTNPANVFDCMRNVPSEKIADADATFIKQGGMLGPRVGDDFLPESPIDLFRTGKFKDTEMLIGFNRDEGTLMLLFRRIDIFGVLGDKFDASLMNETFAREFVQAFSEFESGEEIIESYFGKVKEGSRYTYLNAVSDLLGDYLVTCASVFQADFHSLSNHPVYFYLFDYRPPSSPFAEWTGVYHFGEVQYVFGNPMNNVFSEYEKEFSNDMMDMWVAFAKTGNPSIPRGLKWPRYTYEDPMYFIISQRDRIGVTPDNNRCEAWKNHFRSQVENEVIENHRKID